jgi:hypothetical protein
METFLVSCQLARKKERKIIIANETDTNSEGIRSAPGSRSPAREAAIRMRANLASIVFLRLFNRITTYARVGQKGGKYRKLKWLAPGDCRKVQYVSPLLR